MSNIGRPKKPIKDKGPMKLVRVDHKTIIEVSVKISDKKAIANFLARIAESIPDYSKGGRAQAIAAKKKNKIEKIPRDKAEDDPGSPRRKR